MNLPSQNQTISSREIAEITGKRHSDVLNAIRKMENSWQKVTGRNFSLSEYLDASGKSNPEYQLTKTESLFVGSKFNDESRAKLVIRWEYLENNKPQQKQLSQLDILVQQTNALVEQNNRIEVIEDKIRYIEAQNTIAPDYFAVAGYAALNGIAVSLPVAAALGKLATKECKEQNIMMGKVNHAHYGQINTYPYDVLKNVFAEYFKN